MTSPSNNNPYLPLVAAAAKAAGIDPTWAQATLLTENAPGNPSAVSSAGAEGLMQVLPTSAPGVNLSDPAANIKAGVAMLAANLKAAGGDKSKASAMYFDGPNAKTFGPGAYSYVGKVAQNYNNLESQDMPQAASQSSSPAASDTPNLDALLNSANEQATATATDVAPPSGGTAAQSMTPNLDGLVNSANEQATQQQQAQQAQQAKQGGIGANLKAGMEDVLIRPGLALDNALNGTKVGTFLQNNNILATPAQDEATYHQDTSNLGTTLPDQIARGAGQVATAAPVLATGGDVVGGLAEGAGALADAATGGENAVGNVARFAGNFIRGDAGNVGKGIGQLATKAGSMAAQGAVQGAGFNALTGRSIGEGAAVGAVGGPLLGGAAHVVSSAGNALLDSAKPATQAAASKVSQALARDGITPNQLIATMQAMGPEATAADAGGANILKAADAVATKPGASAELAAANLGQRASERVDRLTGAVQSGTGQAGDIYDMADSLSAQQKAAAAPLYREAFAGGSTAPLETQFENQLNEAGQVVNAAQQQLTQANNAVTAAAGRQATTGGNVYATSGSNADMRTAQQAQAQAEAQLQAAQVQHSAILSRLQQAQADGTANAPGAVWSPRIQQFLDDPVMQAGLKRGLQIQRIESVASGELFNPTEYGVVGNDANGEPIVGAVPNMRTLDAGKRGLDAIVSDNTDPTTGKMNDLGRAVNQFRTAYVQQLDAINPTYAAARAAYAGPAQVKDAITVGQKILNQAPEITASAIAKMSPSEQQGVRAGFTRALTDKMQANPNAAVSQILKNRVMQSKIAAAFPTPQAYSEFIGKLQNEATMMRTENTVTGGSPTAGRFAAISDLATPVSHAVGAGMEAAKGNPIGAALSASRLVGHLSGGTTPTDDAVGKLLLTPGNTDELQNLLMPTRGAAGKAIAATGKAAVTATKTAGTAAKFYAVPSLLPSNLLTSNSQ